MSKVIFALFAIFAIASAASFRASAADNELLVPSNGQIALTYVQGAGWTLPVDLAKNARTTQQMVVSLYSSDVLFAKNCFQFKPYPCSQFGFCDQTTIPYNVAYPYFTASGANVKTQLYADYSAWVLAAGAPAFIATGCAAPTTEAFGTNTLGLVGLGADSAAFANHIGGRKTFSLFFNQGFKLFFNDPLNFRYELRTKVQTDGNWRIPQVAAFKYNTFSTPLAGVSMILDPNSQATALPSKLYTDILGYFAQNYGINCPQVWSTPSCAYKGDATYLPNIEFVINPSSPTGTLLITPQMYAVGRVPGQGFVLNLKGIAPNFSGANYVTPQYQFSIILGQSVLQGYYTSFNTVEKSVSFLRVL